ncbi:MAG: efflux RND transporter periplasmic adaptor subunit [Leptothrix sp. (in: b-proteobacteria)]
MRPVLRTLPAVLLLSLLAACSRPEPAPEPIRAVRTLTVGVESASLVREFAAEVRPRTESRLAFRVGGKLVRRSVDLGDTVKAGQLLAQLDPQDLKLGQEAARAAVQAAQTQQELAAADFKRYKELHQQGFIGAAELERRDATLKAAQATLEQVRAQAGVQVNQASYAQLLADVSGVVIGVDAEPGAVVAAGTPILRLAPDGPRDVVFAVPEDQIGALRALAGRKEALKVRLWGMSEPLRATVREVAAAADATTRTFLVKADVGRAEVRLGQTATVLIDSPQTTGVTRLPLPAVTELGGHSSVWLLDVPTMTVKSQPVTVAGADGNAVLISAGLRPGQEVVTAGVHVLTPGQKVKRYLEPGAATPAAASAAR